ncbi:MAG TPA: bifunctional UDP-N-acetylglucosamine diphosphorylase/glucosamine-1-phosphate N-acetyltransferase GlmU [Anaerolineae bacterium]
MSSPDHPTTQTSDRSLAIIILAAGQGTRLASELAKVLHPVAGRPMIEYAVMTASEISPVKPIVVVGHQAERVRALIGDRAHYVEQRELRGTGHAVMQARELAQGRADTVMVTYGDMPLMKADTLRALRAKHEQAGACMTMLTVHADDSMQFGRIVRDSTGKVLKIVEESEATDDELKIRELNCGFYCFAESWLWDHLARLTPSPTKQEYFLTDLVEMAVKENAPLATVTLSDPTEARGINTRVQLAQVDKIARDHIRERVMLAGVTLVDPGATYIDADVEIGADSVIYPGTYLQGKTKIGKGCQIGPNAQIRDSLIGDACEINASWLEQATLQDHVEIGPFCHLRPNTFLERGVHLGDHAELKNARLGADTKMGHFSYVGDAQVGARVNIGAGTITCNYDGVKKNRTIIEDDAFIGSDTMLVAPVKVGARAKTGAGAVVTKDVPPDSLAVGMPARVIRKFRSAQDS